MRDLHRSSEAAEVQLSHTDGWMDLNGNSAVNSLDLHFFLLH